jgi:hypothetical protein
VHDNPALTCRPHCRGLGQTRYAPKIIRRRRVNDKNHYRLARKSGRREKSVAQAIERVCRCSALQCCVCRRVVPEWYGLCAVTRIARMLQGRALHAAKPDAISRAFLETHPLYGKGIDRYFNNLSSADFPKARYEKPSMCPLYFYNCSYKKKSSLPGIMLPDTEYYVKNNV